MDFVFFVGSLKASDFSGGQIRNMVLLDTWIYSIYFRRGILHSSLWLTGDAAKVCC